MRLRELVDLVGDELLDLFLYLLENTAGPSGRVNLWE